MANIKLRGNQIIHLDKRVAEKIDKDFVAGNLPDVVSIKTFEGQKSFSKSQLLEVNVGDETTGTKNEESDKEYKRKIDIAYKQEHDAFIKLTPEQKVTKSKPAFLLFYTSYCGGEPSQDVLQKVKEVSLKFYKENPKRKLVDADIYKSCVPAPEESEGEAGAMIRIFGLKVYIGAVGEDINFSKFL